MTLADTEYEYELPENCKTFLLHTRDESAFRLAFETGHVATPTEPYLTILANCRFVEPSIANVTYQGELVTLYFASDDAGKVVELVYWT